MSCNSLALSFPEELFTDSCPLGLSVTELVWAKTAGSSKALGNLHVVQVRIERIAVCPRTNTVNSGICLRFLLPKGDNLFGRES